MGMTGLEEIVDAGIVMRERGARRVSPYFVPSILVNLAAGHISLRHKLRVSATHLNPHYFSRMFL